MPRRRPALGYAAAAGSAALVGLFTVLNKWLLTENVPALTAAAYTYGAAGLALLPWAIRGRLELRRPWIIAGWLLAGSAIGPALYFWGLSLTSGVQGVLIINLEAIFTALLAFAIFGEPLGALTALAAVAVVAGGVCLSWPSAGGRLLAGHTLGDLLMAIGYLGWATENNLGRVLGERNSPVTLVCIKSLTAGLMMAALAVVFGQSLAITYRVIPGILLSGAVALGLSLALFYWSMRQLGAARAGLVAPTSVLWGVAAAVLLLHERLTHPEILGGSLMLAGIAALAWETIAAVKTPPSPSQKPTDTPPTTPISAPA